MSRFLTTLFLLVLATAPAATTHARSSSNAAAAPAPLGSPLSIAPSGDDFMVVSRSSTTGTSLLMLTRVDRNGQVLWTRDLDTARGFDAASVASDGTSTLVSWGASTNADSWMRMAWFANDGAQLSNTRTLGEARGIDFHTAVAAGNGRYVMARSAGSSLVVSEVEPFSTPAAATAVSTERSVVRINVARSDDGLLLAWSESLLASCASPFGPCPIPDARAQWLTPEGIPIGVVIRLPFRLMNSVQALEDGNLLIAGSDARRGEAMVARVASDGEILNSVMLPGFDSVTAAIAGDRVLIAGDRIAGDGNIYYTVRSADLQKTAESGERVYALASSESREESPQLAPVAGGFLASFSSGHSLQFRRLSPHDLPPVPERPGIPVVNTTGATVVSWNGSDSVLAYRLLAFAIDDDESSPFERRVSGQTTSYTFGLSPDVPYRFALFTEDTTGFSEAATVEYRTPASDSWVRMPDRLAAAPTPSGARVTWRDRSSNETGFTVSLRQGAALVPLATVGPDRTEVTVELPAGKHVIEVVAHKADVTSQPAKLTLNLGPRRRATR